MDEKRYKELLERRKPSNPCPCGGYMSDWHSHASDCIEINSKGGTSYKDHHIWCNKWHNPRKGCEMCEKLYRDYPVKKGESGDELMKKHFPNNIVRGGKP
jgi:hypothetical protein